MRGTTAVPPDLRPGRDNSRTRGLRFLCPALRSGRCSVHSVSSGGPLAQGPGTTLLPDPWTSCGGAVPKVPAAQLPDLGAGASWDPVYHRNACFTEFLNSVVFRKEPRNPRVSAYHLMLKPFLVSSHHSDERKKNGLSKPTSHIDYLF